MTTTQNPETMKYPRSSQCVAVFHPETVSYWCSGYGWKAQLPWSQRGLWNRRPLRLAGEERRLLLEPEKETPTWTEPMVTQWDEGTAVLKRKRECEEGEHSARFLIIRRQLGAASCWPLMTNNLAIHMMMLCAVHTGYLHLVCYLPDLFLDKYIAVQKRVIFNIGGWMKFKQYKLSLALSIDSFAGSERLCCPHSQDDCSYFTRSI